MKKPNIIFLFSDQQRWDTLGCYGQKLDITPNLDKMANEGVKFTNTFTCQPVCGPARAAIQTGKYPTEVGCHTNNRLLPLDERTIAHALSENGYDVGYIGKWHLASRGPPSGSESFRTRPVPPERRGGYKDFWLASDTLEFTSHSYDGYMFDGDMNKREFPEGRYRVDAQTDWVIEYLENQVKKENNKPFFLFVSYIEPHHQNDHHHYEGPHGSKEKFKDYIVPGDLEGLRGDWKNELPDYLGCCHSLDENVGIIRSKIEELGIKEDTIVLYTSDHGSHFKTRNFEYKRSCHDGCIRIPLIFYGGKFVGGKNYDHMVSLIDLPPTILSLAGIEPPKYMRGRTITDIVDKGKDKDWPDEVFLQISESQVGRAIRTKKWKYSVRAPKVKIWAPNAKIYVEDFLYDLENDPHEHNNLVKSEEYTEIRKELCNILKRRMVEIGETQPEILPNKIPFLKKMKIIIFGN